MSDEQDAAPAGAGEQDDRLEAQKRRARKRRLRERVRLPMVSGRTSVLMLVCCFGLSALIVVPFVTHFSMWIDAEIVLGIWWIVWIAVLAQMLHKGHRISDDHQWSSPRSWFGGKGGGTAVDGADGCLSLGDLTGIELSGGSLAEGCAWAFVVILALCLLVVLAWFVVEVAIPAIAFIIYLLLRGMLARVVNDQHGCENSWPKAVLWGAFWSTVYIVPQALVVFGVHLIAAKAK